MRMDVGLGELDRHVLTLIQAGFPVDPEPYAVLGERLGTNAEQVLESVARLREGGVVRRVGAIFDSHRLGYRSTLCAAA
ncbi:MAG: Lrp/AsnC family transcriptional regulator, partial [Coriobacteriia bacterium]|nr:Lrp/AsnC family transcriptional regulator [Coriobacteriia bacterium]